jgi:hypothetical protein
VAGRFPLFTPPFTRLLAPLPRLALLPTPLPLPVAGRVVPAPLPVAGRFIPAPTPFAGRVVPAPLTELHPRASMVLALGSALAMPLSAMRPWSGCQRWFPEPPVAPES